MGTTYRYHVFNLELIGDELYIVYGVDGERFSNILLITRINLEDLAGNRDELYLSAINYPSQQVQSSIAVNLVKREELNATTLSLNYTSTVIASTPINIQQSSNYAELGHDTVSLVKRNITSMLIEVDTPEETMKYTDFELTGVRYTVKCMYSTGIGIKGIDVILSAKIYVDDKYMGTISKAVETDRQGNAELGIMRDEINATGDIRIEWILSVNGYTVNGTITIKYPFPRTTTTTATTTTTTTIPPPPQATTTTTIKTPPTGGGGITTTTPMGGGTATTTPQAGGGSLLVLILVIIVVIAAVIGFILFRRR